MVYNILFRCWNVLPEAHFTKEPTRQISGKQFLHQPNPSRVTLEQSLPLNNLLRHVLQVHCSIASFKKTKLSLNVCVTLDFFVSFIQTAHWTFSERWAWRCDWEKTKWDCGGGGGDFPAWQLLSFTFSLSSSLSYLLTVSFLSIITFPNLSTFPFLLFLFVTGKSTGARIGVRFFWIAFSVKYVDYSNAQLEPSCLWHSIA